MKVKIRLDFGYLYSCLIGNDIKLILISMKETELVSLIKGNAYVVDQLGLGLVILDLVYMLSTFYLHIMKNMIVGRHIRFNGSMYMLKVC